MMKTTAAGTRAVLEERTMEDEVTAKG